MQCRHYYCILCKHVSFDYSTVYYTHSLLSCVLCIIIKLNKQTITITIVELYCTYFTVLPPFTGKCAERIVRNFHTIPYCKSTCFFSTRFCLRAETTREYGTTVPTVRQYSTGSTVTRCFSLSLFTHILMEHVHSLWGGEGGSVERRGLL